MLCLSIVYCSEAACSLCDTLTILQLIAESVRAAISVLSAGFIIIAYASGQAMVNIIETRFPSLLVFSTRTLACSKLVRGWAAKLCSS